MRLSPKMWLIALLIATVIIVSFIVILLSKYETLISSFILSISSIRDYGYIIITFLLIWIVLLLNAILWLLLKIKGQISSYADWVKILEAISEFAGLYGVTGLAILFMLLNLSMLIFFKSYTSLRGCALIAIIIVIVAFVLLLYVNFKGYKDSDSVSLVVKTVTETTIMGFIILIFFILMAFEDDFNILVALIFIAFPILCIIILLDFENRNF